MSEHIKTLDTVLLLRCEHRAGESNSVAESRKCFKMKIVIVVCMTDHQALFSDLHYAYSYWTCSVPL